MRQTDMRLLWIVLVTFVVSASAACSSSTDVVAGGETDACGAEPGSVTDLDSEPDWRPYADYRPWTDGDGCLLRIDVVAERPGPDHCGWEDAEVLIVGDPLGERYTSPSDAVQYVRDPNGVFGVPALADGFVSDAKLPDGAIDSGYRRDDVSLWHVPGDQSQVWLVFGTTVERWPAGETPICS